ncbi:class I SAM-dependent methyltransferase [Knoellia locipacati]|uniref:Transferase n=2 Tax=Knoellia locipacati TaxID=882824 RepID=A0A512T3N4_9MICO|nr:transferase [Knoellia locipacati]
MDLGLVPPSDAFPDADDPGPDPASGLRLVVCSACLLLQLGPTAPSAPETPIAVDSQTALDHARASVARLVEDEGIAPGARFAAYDSGHGCSWAPFLQEAGLEEADATGAGDVDVLVDVHHLMHDEDLDAVVGRHAARLAPGGVLVAEVFHGRPLVTRTLVDTIRHGHFTYLTLLAAEPLLARHGLVVTRAQEVPSYGGSLLLTARRASEDPVVDPGVAEVREGERRDGLADVAALQGFGTRGRVVARAFREHLEDLRDRGRTVAGYGAPSKAPVLLALARVDRDLLPFTCDLSPAKTGRRIAGTSVPIRSVDDLLAARPSDVVLLTWDLVDEVSAQLAARSAGTGWAPRIYVPLPEPREVSLPTWPGDRNALRQNAPHEQAP